MRIRPMRKMPTLAFGLAATLSTFITGSVSASSERIEATYDLIWKGFHVSTAETVTKLDSDTYFLGINVQTHGLLKMATGGHGTFEISGQLLPGGDVQTKSFDAEGYWDGGAFSQKLRYEHDGRLASAEVQRPEKWQKKHQREDVPEDMKTGPDPASLLVALMQRPINFQAADGDAPIRLRSFDGETVVDWELGCAPEPVTLKRSKHSPHHGKAYECELATTTVAGKLLDENEDEKKMVRRGPRGRRVTVDVADISPKIWLMPMEGSDRLMPVRASVPSEKGMVGLYLSKLSMEEDTSHQAAPVAD